MGHTKARTAWEVEHETHEVPCGTFYGAGVSNSTTDSPECRTIKTLGKGAAESFTFAHIPLKEKCPNHCESDECNSYNPVKEWC